MVLAHATGCEKIARDPTHWAKAVSDAAVELRQPTQAISTLRATYEADRAARDVVHPPISDPGRCRYCGKPWLRFGGTRFDGHVTCAVSDDFQRGLVEVLDTGVSYASVGLQIGVGDNVVRAWWLAVKRSPGR